MATVIRKGEPEIKDPEEVKKFLGKRGVSYERWEVPASAKELTGKQVLTDSEKEELLTIVNDRFEFLKGEHGFTTRDLVVLHKDVPGIRDMLAKFDKVHYHSDVEVRYIIDGSGFFGFHLEEEKFIVYVETSDYIFVPKGVNHWFYLDENIRIKAVRYFKDMSGWVPNYVDAIASID